MISVTDVPERWIVTGHQEAHAVLRDPATFSSYPNNLVAAGDGTFIPVELDPPEHTGYRKALQPPTTPGFSHAVSVRGIVTLPVLIAPERVH